MFKRKIQLPTTLKAFDDLVDKLVKKYHFEDAHHTAAILSVAIRHLPNEQAYATLDYFGQYIQKNLANFIANHKGNVLQHEAQVDQLKSILLKDPNDNQARDALIKAAGEGSDYAKKALESLEPPDNVTSIIAG